ncbi:MAG: GNAT family N-acetyltransferase [Dehalococcoidia bacterium]|nr:GNAT family N-acetyltransferase [Dehalococcoidia bacterium]
MKYIFVPMNQTYANDIASWHYDGTYSFYDMAADEGDLAILMDTKNWRDIIKAVLNETDELVGWAAFYTEKDEFWLSLGLRPDLTGQGLGEQFVSESVNYAISRYELIKHTIRLHVAVFNQRAIRVYQRVGFVETNRTARDTHIGQIDFIEMEKHIPSSAASGSVGATYEHETSRTHLPSEIQST